MPHLAPRGPPDSEHGTRPPGRSRTGTGGDRSHRHQVPPPLLCINNAMHDCAGAVLFWVSVVR